MDNPKTMHAIQVPSYGCQLGQKHQRLISSMQRNEYQVQSPDTRFALQVLLEVKAMGILVHKGEMVSFS